MFSCNGKISEKQLRRMVVLPLFASVIFVLPYVAANLFGDNIVIGLAVFLLLAGLYIIYIGGMGNCYEKCGVHTGKEGYISVLTESGIVGYTLLLVTFVRMIIRLAFYILLAIAILEEAQVPFMLKSGREIVSNLFVVLPLLLVALYGANTDVEKQGRIQELVFWLLFVPFIVVILFGLKEVDYSVFVPRKDMKISEILLNAYLLLTFVLPVENYLYLRPDLRKHREKKRICVAAVAVVLLSGIITLFLLGIYGVHGAGGDPMVTISIMRYIRLPFGVLERFDVLMIWFFMTGIFVLICSTLYYAGHIVGKMWRGKKIWLLIIVLALALVLVVWTRNYENGLLMFMCYGALMDVPLSIVLPLVGIGVNRLDIHKKCQETEEA